MAHATRHVGHSPPVLHHASCVPHRTITSLYRIAFLDTVVPLDRIGSTVITAAVLDCSEMDLRNGLLRLTALLTRCFKQPSITDVFPSAARIVKLQNFLPTLLSKLGQFYPQIASNLCKRAMDG